MTLSFYKKNTHFEKSIFSIFLLFFAFFSLQAQQCININAPSSAKSNVAVGKNELGSEILNIRYFDYNPILKNLTQQNIADTLFLDFFKESQFKAVIKHVSESENGAILVRATMLHESFATCIMIVSEEGISISVQLPMRNEAFFVAKKDGKTYLSQYDLSQLRRKELEGAPSIYDATSSKNHSASSKSQAKNTDMPATIDLLIVYTQAAEEWVTTSSSVTDINHLIDLAIESANETMENSRTHITFNVVHRYKTNHKEADSNDDLYWLRYNNEVQSRKRQYKADAAILIADIDFAGGVGFQLKDPTGSPDDAFAVVRVQQAANSYTLVHEIGHNMGCDHHKQQNSQSGPGLYSYSAGWRGNSANHYSTVMTYENGDYFSDSITMPRIPYFSSPLLTHKGEPIGDALDGDNTLTLKQTKHIVAEYSEILYNASLSEITLSFIPTTTSPPTLSPNFHPDITSYTVIVPPTTPSILIGATALYSNTAVAGTGTKVLNEETEIILTVKANDNITEKSYSIRVIRLPNTGANDNTLMNLSLSSGTLTPAFLPTVTQYNATVPYHVNEITVTALPVNSNATINTKTGLYTEVYPLTVGENMISITVISANGTTQQTYTVLIKRLENSDATLQNIGLSSGSLTPDFNPAIHQYYVSIPFDVEQITINGIPTDNRAAVTGNGEYALSLGNNPILLQVTAADSVGASTYRITVNQYGNDNANLQEITISHGALNPIFSPEITQYEIPIIGASHSITISSNAIDSNATVEGNGFYTIVTGENRIELTVTAQNGFSTKQYVLNFVCTLNSDATLATLTMSEGVLSPVFSPEILEYYTEVSSETESIQVTATANDLHATVIGEGLYPLDNGANTVKIMVLAENKIAQATYEIIVFRRLSQDATLRNLAIYNYVLAPDFNPAIYEYRVEIPENVNTIYISALTNHTGATVEGTGNRILEKGENRLILTVTAQDKITVQNYEILVNENSSVIETRHSTSLQVYPNPTTGELRITNYECGITNVDVFDVYGRMQNAECRMQNTEIVMDISGLSAGIYFLRVDGKTVKIVLSAP